MKKLITLLLISVRLIADVPATEALKRLKQGDTIESLTKDKKLEKLALIKSIQTKRTNILYEIELSDRTIFAAKDQTFWDPQLNKWIMAKDLTADNRLLGRDGQRLSPVKINRVSGDFETVAMNVEGGYLFHDGVLTHNNPAVVGRALWWLGGAFCSALFQLGFDHGKDALVKEFDSANRQNRPPFEPKPQKVYTRDSGVQPGSYWERKEQKEAQRAQKSQPQKPQKPQKAPKPPKPAKASKRKRK